MLSIKESTHFSVGLVMVPSKTSFCRLCDRGHNLFVSVRKVTVLGLRASDERKPGRLVSIHIEEWLKPGMLDMFRASVISSSGLVVDSGNGWLNSWVSWLMILKGSPRVWSPMFKVCQGDNSDKELKKRTISQSTTVFEPASNAGSIHFPATYN